MVGLLAVSKIVCKIATDCWKSTVAVGAMMSKICPGLTPDWDEGEAALRSPWPHLACATGG